LRVFVDIPLSSTELFVRSRLFVMSEQKYMQISRTKVNMSEFSKFAKLGNMDPRYSEILGDL
jgi:hypothetical protein